MSDIQETKCIITALLALRYQTARDINSNNDVVLCDQARQEAEKKQGTEITLPDAIIRHLILSYRPFRSFRVVLIRGENNGVYGTNNYGGSSSNPRKREYSLTFGTNRGNLRFEVVELPYLPPNNKSIDAETYRGADGVVISCYMSRFFEFCDRYGYNYASSSILEDVKARREPNMARRDDEIQGDTEVRPEDNGKYQSRRNDFPRCIVLCGNNVDITHVDARLSSIVFCEEPEQSTTTSDASERKYSPPNSHIETPRHPFSSLARSLTKDYGLEFHNVCASGSSGEPYQLSSSANETHHDEEHWNHDEEARNWNWLRAQVT